MYIIAYIILDLILVVSVSYFFQASLGCLPWVGALPGIHWSGVSAFSPQEQAVMCLVNVYGCSFIDSVNFLL